MKVSPLAKRKRKAAGRKVAPLIATPNVPFLNDDEWLPFSQWLPSRPQNTLRGELDRLMITYLGILEAEATSPSAREVATVLAGVARRARQFAQELCRLDSRLDNERREAFNTANEAAADSLAKFSIKSESVLGAALSMRSESVLDAARRVNKVLAVVAGQEAKKLAESSSTVLVGLQSPRLGLAIS